MRVSLPSSRVRAIRRRLLVHYDRERRELPWRGEADPYRIWVSEVILQQTRVGTAIPFYRRWLDRFPTLEALAASDPEDVRAAWSGLGYYRRAENLHRAARIVRDRLGGRLPTEADQLMGLPGIGPYTAGAVASIAFGRREPAVDGNARRVLARLFDLEDPGGAELARLAGALVPPDRPGDFNQALMELGATVCRPRRPLCEACPVEAICQARSRGTVDKRPRAAPARAVPEEVVGTAIIMSQRGRILLARRPAQGLLGGMWEFPGAIADADEPPQAAAGRALRALLGRGILEDGICTSALTVVPQAFSHRRLVYHAFLFELGREIAPRRTGARASAAGRGIPAWTAAEWVSLAAAGERALPAAQRTIADAMDQLGSRRDPSSIGSSKVR
ncbi:MAG: A/G-specific adenine glycosylase [Gemmatimonadota bacterium]